MVASLTLPGTAGRLDAEAKAEADAKALAAFTSAGIGNRLVLDAIFSRRLALVFLIRSANSSPMKPPSLADDSSIR